MKPQKTTATKLLKTYSDIQLLSFFDKLKKAQTKVEGKSWQEIDDLCCALQKSAYLAGLSACACGPWISTKDRLPEHDREVLVWCEEEAYIAYFDSTKQWNGLGLPEDSNLVTHWAELGGRMPTEKEPKATELREPKG